MLVIADRGSVLQVVVAACLSLGFIVLHQSLWPYKLSADNLFKAAVEIQIFLTILVALVLKTDLRAEAVGGRPAARILSVDAFSSRRMAADAFSLCGIQQVFFTANMVFAVSVAAKFGSQHKAKLCTLRPARASTTPRSSRSS